MRERVLSALPTGQRPAASVIPTWEPVALFPEERRLEAWTEYAEPDLAGRFIVLHLGNLGFGYRTDTIAEAAAALAEEDVTFLFVGGGERFPELAREAAKRHADNVRFRDYVPREQTPAVLAGAGCTLVSLDDHSIGIQSPCKLNGSLAMGLPVVYAGPEGSNVDRAIVEYDCGFSLRQGDIAGLTDAIRRLRSDPVLAAKLSRNARRAFEEAHSDRSALPGSTRCSKISRAPGRDLLRDRMTRPERRERARRRDPRAARGHRRRFRDRARRRGFRRHADPRPRVARSGDRTKTR